MNLITEKKITKEKIYIKTACVRACVCICVCMPVWLAPELMQLKEALW